MYEPLDIPSYLTSSPPDDLVAFLRHWADDRRANGYHFDADGFQAAADELERRRREVDALVSATAELGTELERYNIETTKGEVVINLTVIESNDRRWDDEYGRKLLGQNADGTFYIPQHGGGFPAEDLARVGVAIAEALRATKPQVAAFFFAKMFPLREAAE